MPMARRAASAFPPPLLVWRERSEVERMEEEREALRIRIARLRPNSHYRLELEARLRDLTGRQMRLEMTIRR